MTTSIEFLKKFHPDGPWVLTAIQPDKKGIQTKTFKKSGEKLLKVWLEQFNGNRNIYFHVNPPLRELTKKAERQDIKSVNWLHVDIDPRAGEDIEKERERALALLTDPPGDVPRPTAIVFSGGGYQGFWKLKEPIPIDGDLSKAEEAKRYNIQLEIAFGADNCHNIDRIMRLPGTMNIPDAKKRKKGRKEVKAELVYWDGRKTYNIDKFTPAPIVHTEATEGFSANSVEVSGNIERLNSVEDLPESVSDYIKVLIVQGTDPNEPDKFPSRSETVFTVCCGLVKAGVDNNTIYSVLTDPDFLISESILEKGTNAQRYATRQIERAKEFAIEPGLMKLNEKHAVISDASGKCRVISEVYDYVMQRYKISRQSFQDFKNRYMHKQVVVGQNKEGMDVRKPIGEWWLKHELRRQYETIVFAPGKIVENSYNLWKGFGCEMKVGDCSLFLNHVKENVCGGNDEYYRYLLGWMATAVQYPDRPGGVAVVLRGRMGTGKSKFAKLFGSLWGRHFLQVSDPKHLVGNFNAHLRDCVVLFADEAFYAGDKKHEGILKMIVTEETLIYEAKGVDAETGSNFTHLILASNNNWVVPAGADERRFFVLDVGEGQMQNAKYFRRLDEQMNNGGREALLHYLMTYDLTNYELRKIPKTKALIEQKELSMSPEEDWWYDKLKEGTLIRNKEWGERVLKEEVLDDYILTMKKFNVNKRSSSTQLGIFLRKVCPPGKLKTGQGLFDTKDGDFLIPRRKYYYEFPPLEVCRAHWDENFGGPFEWEEIDIIEEEPEQVF